MHELKINLTILKKLRILLENESKAYDNNKQTNNV